MRVGDSVRVRVDVGLRVGDGVGVRVDIGVGRGVEVVVDSEECVANLVAVLLAIGVSEGGGVGVAGDAEIWGAGAVEVVRRGFVPVRRATACAVAADW